MIISRFSRLVTSSRNCGPCHVRKILSNASFSSSSAVHMLIARPSSQHITANQTFLSTTTISVVDQSPVGGTHYNQQQRCIATRRRRRGGGGSIVPSMTLEEDTESKDSDTSSYSDVQSTSLSYDQFLSVSNTLLDKVESTMAKLKDSNDGLEITRYPSSTTDHGASESAADDDDIPESQQHGGQLSIRVESTGDLFWGGGTYWLTILPNDPDGRGGGGIVTLRSPLSGTFSYVYDASSGEWVGSEDGHSMLGMLTRDWIRQCRGVPDF